MPPSAMSGAARQKYLVEPPIARTSAPNMNDAPSNPSRKVGPFPIQQHQRVVNRVETVPPDIHCMCELWA